MVASPAIEIMIGKSVGRNDPCSCGSGRKFKHCCERTGSNGPRAGSPSAWTEWYESGNYAFSQGALDHAIDCFRRAIALEPRRYEAYSNLGVALESRGLLYEAIECYQLALEHGGRSPQAEALRLTWQLSLKTLQTQLFGLMRSGGCGATETFAAHRRFGELCEAHLRPSWRPHANTVDPERKLRIGYVSPDFRKHPVAHFFEPIASHHDRSQVEVYCYYSCPIEDAITHRIAASSDHWLDCLELSDQILAERIRADRIDILVDLAGHTTGSRLLSFALRPAPVQISYLGYPGTTGLSSIDYRLTDRLADPPGLADALFTEKPLSLEQAMLVYRPAFGVAGLLGEQELPLSEPPLLRLGAPSFGSFGDASKLTNTVIETWAAVIAAVPRSTLTLKCKGLDDRKTQQGLLARFGQHGISPDRLIFLGRDESPFEHLCRYAQIDISLDTFPYNGVTTSCESIWMGVPVITLEGTTLASRMGVSIVSHLGHPEWIARTPLDYVEKAAALAADRKQLIQLRGSLRQRLQASPLMDMPGFARRLEAAYRRAWRLWCAGQLEPDAGRMPAAPAH